MRGKTDEYKRYIHSAEWRRKANERLALDKHTCRVCGKPAAEVHHLTYDRFRNEQMDDLVSLCHQCHVKAEELYDPAVTPWAMEEVKPGGNNFMAAMRVDALNVAPIVYDYLKAARGADFDSLMVLRQPADTEKYWMVLKNAVNALCRKRYSMNCVEDRRDMMLGAVLNRVSAISLSQIEHYARNAVQHDLHEIVVTEYALFEKWNAVGDELGIPKGTLQTLRRDEGANFGPSLREAVLYYCGLDAAAGIRPLSGFSCLSDTDYEMLNTLADYMAGVSGDGDFKGEYEKEDSECVI